MWTLEIAKTGHRHKRALGRNWKEELKRDGEMGRIKMKTMIGLDKNQIESYLKDTEIFSNNKLEY
jgi:hypothetical protein